MQSEKEKLVLVRLMCGALLIIWSVNFTNNHISKGEDFVCRYTVDALMFVTIVLIKPRTFKIGPDSLPYKVAHVIFAHLAVACYVVFTTLMHSIVLEILMSHPLYLDGRELLNVTQKALISKLLVE
jgi:hypothetical protein